MPNYAKRRDKWRQKNTRHGARKWFKRMLARFERRQARALICTFLAGPEEWT